MLLTYNIVDVRFLGFSLKHGNSICCPCKKGKTMSKCLLVKVKVNAYINKHHLFISYVNSTELSSIEMII